MVGNACGLLPCAAPLTRLCALQSLRLQGNCGTFEVVPLGGFYGKDEDAGRPPWPGREGMRQACAVSAVRDSFSGPAFPSTQAHVPPLAPLLLPFQACLLRTC